MLLGSKQYKYFLSIDIDECVELKNVCGKGNCTNSIGSYSCKCEPGYKPADDSPSCVGE